MMRCTWLLVPIVPLTMTVRAMAAGDKTNLFEGTIYQAVATAIVFLVVFMVLKRVAWGKILQGLQDREDKIRKDLEDAHGAARKADETLKQYKAMLAEGRDEAQKLIDRSRSEAERISHQMREDAATQITQMRQRAAHDIQSAKEQAINDIYSEVAGLSTAVAGRILQREIDGADQQRLIQASLDELASSRN